MADNELIPDVLITAAVAGEIGPLLDQVRFPVEQSIGRRSLIRGFLNDIPLRLVVSGPGLVNTAQALTAVIESGRPALVIQTGCAGAFRTDGRAIGDIGLAVEEIDAQLGLEAADDGISPEPLPFPMVTTDGVRFANRYPLNASLVDAAVNTLNNRLPPKSRGVFKGTFLTVSTITTTDRRADRLYRRFSACMESMEGSAGAHVALHYGIPFLEVRAASNFVGRRDRKSWDLDLAFDRAARAVSTLIRDPGFIQPILKGSLP